MLRSIDCTPDDPGACPDAAICRDNRCVADHLAFVKQALACLVRVGTSGCQFVHPLEAARWALDPEGIPRGAEAGNRDRRVLTETPQNPGFSREDAALAIAFLSDRDDCSAADDGLFNSDPFLEGINAPLGPLGPFRCFEFGINCDGFTQNTAIGQNRAPGPRLNCRPTSYDRDMETNKVNSQNRPWLFPVDEYVSFFQTLKREPRRVVMHALAGPIPRADAPQPIEVFTAPRTAAPGLRPTCQGSGERTGHPAIRIQSVVSSFGDYGAFNAGVDALGVDLPADICQNDYTAGLRLFSATIGKALTPPDPLTPED